MIYRFSNVDFETLRNAISQKNFSKANQVLFLKKIIKKNSIITQ